MSIVFLHLQKSGGSTVHSLLRSQFPEERFAKRDIAGHIIWETNGDAGKLVVSGHVTAGEIHRFVGNPQIYTVLRAPEERLLSHFYFLKSHTVEVLQRYRSPLLLRIKGMSLYEFLRDQDVEDWFRDFYVKTLDPKFVRGKETTPDLDRALEFLKSCNIVGTTDDLTGFIRAFFKALDLAPPKEIPHLNSLASREGRPGYDPIEVKSLSPQERALLREYSLKDRFLYDLARALAPRSRRLKTMSLGGLGNLLKRAKRRLSATALQRR